MGLARRSVKSLRRLGETHVMSPEQFDSVMAQYSGTQPMRAPVEPEEPRRNPGHLERKPG